MDASHLTEQLKSLRLENAENDASWTLQESPSGGLGVFATGDIKCGQVVFSDWPIVTGPRRIQPLASCVVCCRQDKPLRPCSNDCHLPLCDDCQSHESHRDECVTLMRLEPVGDSWSWTLFRSLTIVRCLSMGDRERSVVRQMHASRGESVDSQINNLVKSVKNEFSPDQLAWMTHCAGVIDGTGFELPSPSPDGHPPLATLKGLYPIAGRVNHSCRPNTRRHFVDARGTMGVVASRDVSMGEEVTVSYCPLLWPTFMRRSFLLATKQFECACVRCRESNEFDDQLAQIYCKCKGTTSPANPMNSRSEWRCRNCHLTTPHKVMALLLPKIIQTKRQLPPHNYFTIHENLASIWNMTSRTFDLTDEQLWRRKATIDDILRLMEDLQLGETRKKGLLLEKLALVEREMAGRGMVDYADVENVKMRARSILKDDVTS